MSGRAGTSDAAGSTPRSLIVRLKGRDAGAWRDLIHLYSPLVVYWCRRQGAQDGDCEDILQDVFRTVVTSIDRFRRSKTSGTFRGWLRTVTRSRLIDFYRRRGDEPDAAGGTEAQLRFGRIADTRPGRSETDDSAAADSASDRALFLRAIEMIRDDFRPNTWQAFWRTAIDDCSAADVADELGMTPGAVRVAKSRVLQRLRDRLGDIPE